MRTASHHAHVALCTLANAGLGLALTAGALTFSPAPALADQPAGATEAATGAVIGASANSSAIAAIPSTPIVNVVLSDTGVTVNGAPASESQNTADGANTEAAAGGVYTAHDVVYYEDRDAYDSGNPYGEGTADERHGAADAAAVTVVHISQPGVYRLSGTLSAGQIAVDLGEDAAEDPGAVVTLVLDGIDVTCSVAPAVVFYNVYECDGGWSTETAGPIVDTSAAGANVVLADGSVNTVTGSHVARIYKDKDGQKKLWKMDGAFYSFMSMNVDGGERGTGTLTINADNEGLDSELHLTVNGGSVNIFADNDGINTNEDGVSVTTVNGGSLHILAGLGAEGDGVDSNGWLVINGGTVIAMANPASDSGLDSDMGSYINGGTVVALGSTMDWAESDSNQVTMNLQFAAGKDAGDAIVVTDEQGTVVFAYDPSEDEVAGARIRSFSGAILSCPAFEVGGTYQLFMGGTVAGEEVQGVYDAQTITAYESGAQQSFTGTDVQRGPGGFGGPSGQGGPGGPGAMGERPAGGPGATGERPTGEMPARPEGAQPPDSGMPADGMPEPPEGFAPVAADAFGSKDGMGRGDVGAPGAATAMGSGLNDASANTLFYAQDKVNNYSGIANANA